MECVHFDVLDFGCGVSMYAEAFGARGFIPADVDAVYFPLHIYTKINILRMFIDR